MSRPTVPITAVFWLVGLTIAWGTNWPLMKVALSEIPIFTFRFLTAFGGGVLVLAVSAAHGNAITLVRGEKKVAALAAIFNIVGWFYFTALGITLLPAGRSAVLAYTMPLFAILAAWIIRHEPITGQKGLGLGFGMAAILLLLSENLGQIGAAPFGLLAILSAAASWGIGTIIQKRHWETPVLTLAGWQLLMGAVPLAALAFLHDTAPFERITLHGLLSMVYVILVGTVFGFWAWFTILTLASASVAAIAVLPVPMIGVLTSVLILGERAGWREILALMLITAALATVLPLPRPFRRR
jgi:drug/metabolite transporter (DMT)-like permease